MFSKNILVSIITPTFNAENFILNTIKSVVNQTYKNWELLVVDDGSFDRTPLILKQFAKTDKRIKLHILKTNSGAAAARNFGISKSEGHYIAFLDCDDLWHPLKLELQTSYMISSQRYFSYHRHNKVSSNGKLIKKFTPPNKLDYKRALLYNPLHTSSVMYDATKLGKIYMPLIRKRQDYGLWLRILKATDGYLLDETLSYYVQRQGSMSEKKVELIKYNWLIYRKWEDLSVVQSLYYLTWDIISKVLRFK